MKKFFSIFFVFAFSVFGIFAKDSEKSTKDIGLEIGINLINQYAIGDFSEYAKATLGGEVFVNYVLPKKIIKIDNFGVNANFSIAKVFPIGNYVEKFSQNLFSFGAFYLINLPQNFQLKPQLNLGMINHNFERSFLMKNSYSDFMICSSFDVRYVFNFDLILNVSPVYTLVPVKDGTLNYFGVKIGASYRF